MAANLSSSAASSRTAERFTIYIPSVCSSCQKNENEKIAALQAATLFDQAFKRSWYLLPKGELVKKHLIHLHDRMLRSNPQN